MQKSLSYKRLVVCGSNKVIIVSINVEKNKNSIIWQWQPEDARSLPPIYVQKYFDKIDECKPTQDGKNIMITSSTGGVAIIDKVSKDVIFNTQIGNPHSIEELPNNILAVVASNGKNGNAIALFRNNTFEKKPFFKDSLYGGHGVVWDSKRELLYALGENELRTYKLLDWSKGSPKLKIQNQWNLPDIGGHDLVGYDSDELLITTNNNVWSFHKVSKTFKIFKPLEGTKNIKGLSIKNNSIAYVQAEESWWSHNIHVTNPVTKISIPDMNLYKVRWWSFD